VAIGCIGGETGFDALVEMLREHDPYVQYGVLEGLGFLAPEDWDLSRLLALATDPEATASTRMHAAIAVGEWGDASSGPALLEIFRNEPDPGVRRWTASALGGIDYREAIPDLREGRTDPNPAVAAACTEALCRLGCEVTVRALLTGAEPGGEESRARARYLGWLLASEELAQEVDERLVRWINAEDHDLRGAAMQAVQWRRSQGRTLSGLPEALETFLRRPKQPAFTGIDDQLAPGLLAAADPQRLCSVAAEVDLSSWSELAREKLASALGLTGLADAVPALERLLRDDDPWVRRHAARGLSGCEGEAPRQLVEELSTGPWKDASIAAEALLWFDTEWAVSLLDALGNHDDGRVRRRLRSTLSVRESRRNAAELVAVMAPNASAIARWSYAEALKNVGDENTLEALEELAVRSQAGHDPHRIVVAQRSYKWVGQRLEKLRDELRRET
jgi:HEAT repeat protein